MDHKEFIDLIDTYITTDLSQEKKEDFEIHMFECDECFEKLVLHENILDILTKKKHSDISVNIEEILKKKIKEDGYDELYREIMDTIKRTQEEDPEYYQRLKETTASYGTMAADKEDSNSISTIEQKAPILSCLNNLEKDVKSILLMHFLTGKNIKEISEELTMSSEKINQKKWIALALLLAAVSKKRNKESGTRLYDIGIEEDTEKEKVDHEARELSDEAKKEAVNAEYTNMLSHTIYKVAKVMPISDMMDEYLMGRLESEQKKLFEEHLLECDECRKKFEERKNLVSAIKSVLKDIG